MAKRKYESAYNKQRSALERRIKSLEERGYIIPENLLPDKPKTITQSSVNRLKRLRANIYSKIEFVDPRSGAIVTGKRGREIERSEAGKKAWETRKQKQRLSDVVLRKLFNYLNGFSSNYPNRFFGQEQDSRRDELLYMLQTAIDLEGRNTVAKRLENASESIIDEAITYIVSSDAEERSAAYYRISSAVFETQIFYSQADMGYGL